MARPNVWPNADIFGRAAPWPNARLAWPNLAWTCMTNQIHVCCYSEFSADVDIGQVQPANQEREFWGPKPCSICVSMSTECVYVDAYWASVHELLRSAHTCRIISFPRRKPISFGVQLKKLKDQNAAQLPTKNEGPKPFIWINYEMRAMQNIARDN